jgi:hypothetical protein
VGFSQYEVDQAFGVAEKMLAHVKDGKMRRLRSDRIPSSLSDCSFIKIAGKIYAIIPSSCSTKLNYRRTGILGEGGFGKVRLTMDRDQNWYVLKVQTTLASSFMGEEAKIAYSLGEGISTKPFQRDYSTDVYPSFKHKQIKYYTIMRYRGISLSSYMKANPDMTPRDRLELAIKICKIVSNFHSGHHESNNSYKVSLAHGDLKQENMTIDSDGQIHLIDFGLTTPNIQQKPSSKLGSLYYLPADRFFDHSYRQLDILALKRILFMSRSDVEQIFLNDGGGTYRSEKSIQKEVDHIFGYFVTENILTQSVLIYYDLESVLRTDFSNRDTSAQALIDQLERAKKELDLDQDIILGDYQEMVYEKIMSLTNIQQVNYLNRLLKDITRFQYMCLNKPLAAAKLLCYLDSTVVRKIFSQTNPLKHIPHFNLMSRATLLSKKNILIELIKSKSVFAKVLVFDPKFFKDLHHPIVVEFFENNPDIKKSLSNQSKPSLPSSLYTKVSKSPSYSQVNLISKVENTTYNYDEEMMRNLIDHIKNHKNRDRFSRLWNKNLKQESRLQILMMLQQGQVFQKLIIDEPTLLIDALHALSRQICQLNWQQDFSYLCQDNIDHLKIALLNPNAQIIHQLDGIYIQLASNQLQHKPVKLNITDQQLALMEKDDKLRAILDAMSKLDVSALNFIQPTASDNKNTLIRSVTSEELSNLSGPIFEDQNSKTGSSISDDDNKDKGVWWLGI